MPIVIVLVVVFVGVGAAIYHYTSASTPASHHASAPDAAAGVTRVTPPRPPSWPRSRPRPRSRALPERSVELPPVEGRDTFVRDRVLTLLGAYPGVATLSSVTCQDEHCRVVLEVPDMKTFRPAYARLQDTAFVGLAKSILLANPEPIDNKGTHRVRFTVEFGPH